MVAMGLTLITLTNCGPMIPTSPSLPLLVFYVLSSDLPLGTLRCCLNTLLIMISFVSYYVANLGALRLPPCYWTSHCAAQVPPQKIVPPTQQLCRHQQKSVFHGLLVSLDRQKGFQRGSSWFLKRFKLVSLWLVTLTKILMPTSATSPRNSKTPTPLSSPTL